MHSCVTGISLPRAVRGLLIPTDRPSVAHDRSLFFPTTRELPNCCPDVVRMITTPGHFPALGISRHCSCKLFIWRPRRDLNPCYRRERTTTIRKYNDLQEAAGDLSPCSSVQANSFTYRNPYREKKPLCCMQSYRISIYIHFDPFLNQKQALVWKEGTAKLPQALEPGGRSGMALSRKRFASTEKSPELAHEILGFKAQSISGHSTTTGP